MIIAALLVGVVAGCTSSPASTMDQGPISPPQHNSTPPTTRHTTGTAKTMPPTTSPAPTSKESLSAFEDAPAVQAMRKWAYQAARTVNSGHYIDDALRPLMTASFAGYMKQVLGGDVGLRYPGPIPLQPVGIIHKDYSHVQVRICDVYDGYAVDPATSRPPRPRKVSPAYAYLVLQNGTWLMNALLPTKSFSCKHVKVRYPSW